MSAIFSPSLTQDINKFRELFFSGKNEIEEIRRCPIPHHPGFYIQSRWRWAIEAIAIPFKLISTAIFYAVAYTARFLKIYWLSTRCFILGYRFLSSDPISDYNQYGNRLLVSSFNNHQLLDSDVYNRAPIKIEDVPNPTIYQLINQVVNLENTKPKNEKAANFSCEKLIFNHTREGGLCGGSCRWFIFLFLKAFINNPSLPLWKRAYSVAKQFEYGQPKQASLLQTYYGTARCLLTLQWESPLKIDLENPNWNQIPDGTYYVISGKHGLVFMKEKNEQYAWDSNAGLIEICDNSDLSALVNKYCKSNPEAIFLRLLLGQEHVNQSPC